MVRSAMKWVVRAVAIATLVAGLGLALAGLVLGIRNGHVECCYSDMLITPKLSEALVELGVTDQQLAAYLAKRDERFASAQASPEDRQQMAFAMAEHLTPDARELYLQKNEAATKLSLIGGAIACVASVFLWLATVSRARAKPQSVVASSEANASPSA